jgi:hypothetical protein
MEEKEPKNLCETCGKMHECFQKGIPERETCDQYQPLSLDELVERDTFIGSCMVGPCPECDSENTYDCDNPLELIVMDPTVGHCLDCGAYWCLECGFVFHSVEKGMQCPHWRICAECSDDMGYMSQDDFIEKICPTCEHYGDGCLLDDPSKCDKESQYTCAYEADVSECSKIKGFLEEKM